MKIRLDTRIREVWGQALATVMGIEPIRGINHPRWGYLPLEQYIFYKLENGRVIRGHDNKYLGRVWPLIGKRVILALTTSPVNAKIGEESPKNGSVVGQQLPLSKSQDIVIVKSFGEPSQDVATHAQLTGVVREKLSDHRYLVDIGCGTVITLTWRRSPESESLEVGKRIRVKIDDISIVNLIPNRSMEYLPSRLLSVRGCPCPGLEASIFAELLNGEIIYGWDGLSSRDFTELKNNVMRGKTVAFPYSLARFTYKSYEHLSKPRRGIVSNLTKFKREILLNQSRPKAPHTDPELDQKTITIPVEESLIRYDTEGWIERLYGEIAPKMEMKLYGVLVEVPRCEHLLLDTGMGTFFARNLPSDFAVGDSICCTIEGTQMNITSLFNDFYPRAYPGSDNVEEWENRISDREEGGRCIPSEKVVHPLTSSERKSRAGRLEAKFLGAEIIDKGLLGTGLYQSQYIYFEMDDGQIIRAPDTHYLTTCVSLVGSRVEIAVEASCGKIISETRYGFESPLTEMRDKILSKKERCECENPLLAFGRVMEIFSSDRCILDIGSGTIALNGNPGYPLPGGIKIGDHVQCQVHKILISSLPLSESDHEGGLDNRELIQEEGMEKGTRYQMIINGVKDRDLIWYNNSPYQNVESGREVGLIIALGRENRILTTYLAEQGEVDNILIKMKKYK